MGFVEAGYGEFSPLIEFRDWLASIRNDANRRLARRRNGKLTVTNDGVFIPGPFTLETRQEILERLIALQEATESRLISEEEIFRIRELWAEDAEAFATRSIDESKAVERAE